MTPPKQPRITRAALLGAAFDQVWQHGFRATSMDDILASTGVTKGALYHHFRNKTDLGYALIDELLRPWVEQTWVTPLQQASDPVAAIRAALKQMSDDMPPEKMVRGCPLNNLTQEMSGIDEGFRLRLLAIYERWCDALAEAIRAGKRNGKIRRNVRPHPTAAFIVASIQGAIGLMKNQPDGPLRQHLFHSFNSYLNQLKPEKKHT